VSTSFEPNDELRRIWQALDRPKSDREVQEIMRLVETRAKKFERKIFWRNAGEYIAGAMVTGMFALFAYHGTTTLERVGHSIVSASGLWIILFMWLMQKSGPEALPESPGEVYKKALLVKYDRQILLTRTAWAWYVLPPFTGVVIAIFGHSHSSAFSFALASFMVAFGVAVALLNRHAAKKIATEKHDLERLLEAAE
jgi:hypothetical protein